MSDGLAACQVCGSGDVRELEAFSQLCQATSDNKPWGRGGRKWVCGECGCVQARVDSAWMEQAAKIYDGYLVGQVPVFGPQGATGSKFGHLITTLQGQEWLPRSASALYVACGDGLLLRELAQAWPAWRLFGQDIDPKYRDEVEAITGAGTFYDDLDEAPDDLDLIFCTDLEHIPDPAGALRSFRDKLKPGGVVVLLVTDFSVHHCQLLIAEECTHFTARTVERLAQRIGFAPLPLRESALPPRYALLCAEKSEAAGEPPSDTGVTERAAVAALDWLLETAAVARAEARGKQLGVFGAAVTGCWLSQELAADHVAFFVDEDEGRQGTFLGKPLLHPRDVPSGSTVFIPYPDHRAQEIGARLSDGWGIDCVLAPSSAVGRVAV